MATIDVGAGATDRASSANTSANYTFVDKNNAANDTGTLDTFEIYANMNMSDVKMGTFSLNDATYHNRDYENIGSVTASSKQTFTGKNCDVTSGDMLGFYFTSGKLEEVTSGNGRYYISGDKFGGGSNTYLEANYYDAVYATGATAAAGNPYYYYLNQ